MLDGRNGKNEFDGLFDVWQARSTITAVRPWGVTRFCDWLRNTISRNWMLEEAFRVRVGIIVSPSAPDIRRAFQLAETVQFHLGPTEPPVIVINDVRRLGSDNVRRAMRDSRTGRTAYRIRHVPGCGSPLALRQIAHGGYLTDLLPDTDQFAEQAQEADARAPVVRWWEVATDQLQPLIPTSAEPVAVGRNTASLRNRLRAQAHSIRSDKKADNFIELVRDPELYRTLGRRFLEKIKSP
ncbi:hypothetical protein [Rhodovibrio sodomensis]|uniref:hypothetical protein n=1 Tax=Rhodovibrio sodomensis TaxID=1088 RepID=UPI00190744C3|nr:hypothetical protein [Rhodovibrio sodomensis]